jgi:hypothetical protein
LTYGPDTDRHEEDASTTVVVLLDNLEARGLAEAFDNAANDLEHGDFIEA